MSEPNKDSMRIFSFQLSASEWMRQKSEMKKREKIFYV